MDLEGSAAIVTGAAGGIGRATVRAFLAAGTNVCAVDRAREALDQLVKDHAGDEERLLALEVDVTSPESLREMYRVAADRFGRVDIVHNNAGILGGAVDWPEIDLDSIRRLVDVNLLSVLFSSRLAIDAMSPSGGVIVNTSSKTAFHPGPMLATYATTKAAIAFFTQSCAALKDTHRIRVNAVLPAAANTGLLRTGGSEGELVGFLQGKVKPDRLVAPERVAEVVLDLCRDESAAGQCVVVDPQ